MNNINVITAPDIIYSDTLSILAVHPSKAITQELQDQLSGYPGSCNVYIYEDNTEEPSSIDWLLNVFKLSNVVILDLDNASPKVRTLSSYFIAKPKTYWLTNSTETVYTHLSRNRVYNLDFMSNLGGYFETEQL